MNEKDVLRRSFYVFIVGCLLFAGIGIFFQDISYLLGFVLGYLINDIVFLLIIKMTDEILKTSMSTVIVAIIFLLKLILYALGFIVAIKSVYIHIVGVFFGYLITKISIYIEGYIHKGGD